MKHGEKHWKTWKMRNALVGPVIWQETWKTWKMRHKHFWTWNTARNTEKDWRWEMLTLGPGIWLQNWKSWKNRNTHFRMWNMERNTEKREKWKIHTGRTWIMTRKLKNGENEAQTLWDLLNGEKHWKTWKMRNAHCRTRSMERILKFMENDKHKL